MMMMMMITIIIIKWETGTTQNHSEHIEKAWNRGSTENSHLVHCTHTAESTDVKVKTFSMEIKITCTIHFNHRIAATLYTPET